MTLLYYPPTQNGLSKTLSAQLDQGVTSAMTLNNVTGVQNKPGIVLLNRINSGGTEQPAANREWVAFTGTSGVTCVTLTRGIGGSTDQDHAVGTIVEFVIDITWAQNVIDSLLALVTSAGILDTTKVVDLNTAQTLTNKKLKDTTNTIVNASDTTKVLKADLSGATTGKTVTVVSAHTNDRTITLPDATDTLTGKATTDTLTNKRITKRVFTSTDTGTLTPEISTYDVFHITALAQAITIANHSTSTPADGDMMLIRLLDNGTARAISFGNAYVAKAGVALPTTTTLSKNLSLLFQWNANLGKWNLLASGLES